VRPLHVLTGLAPEQVVGTSKLLEEAGPINELAGASLLDGRRRLAAGECPMKVDVARPEVAGETVVFRWTQSKPNPFQRQNAFFFRYEGIDLAAYSSWLFYEIFVALQLKVLKAYGEPVEVCFPEPLARASVEFWRAFHDAELVTIGPLVDSVDVMPRRAPIRQSLAERPYAVFFGGGKDSTLTAELLAELHGGEQVLLVQFVGPLNSTRELERRLTLRQEAQMLGPARRRLGAATQRVWTDYQAQFRSAANHARPHVELYTAGALPALLAWGVELATFSYAWTEYALTRRRDGTPRFRFAGSRPESLADQSRHYRRAFGLNLVVTNLGMMFSGLAAYRLLAERYPVAALQIVPCTIGGIGERWCYDCKKCGNFALIGLAGGIADPTFDYDRFFAQSRFVRGLVAYAESGVERSFYGNAPWTSKLTAPVGYASFCQAIATLPLAAVVDRLGPRALANLLVVQALFGNREFPGMGMLPAKTIGLLGHETARRAACIGAEHLTVVDDLPMPHLAGNAEIEWDFAVPMSTRTGRLPHLRGERPIAGEAPR
jgi:hypothetical protein